MTSNLCKTASGIDIPKVDVGVIYKLYSNLKQNPIGVILGFAWGFVFGGRKSDISSRTCRCTQP